MPSRIPRLCLTMIVLLLLMPTLPNASAAPPGFPDVPPDAPYTEAVRELAARGIVRGYPDGRFGPEDTLLRAQTAVTLVRAMELSSTASARVFSDRGDTDEESWLAVRLLADRDIARGFSDGTFQPAGPLTRQQAISLVSRAMVALDRWQPQPPTPLFSDVAWDHLADVATYISYVQGVAGTAGPTPDALNPLGAVTFATRGWYAEMLWAAFRQPQAAKRRPPPMPTATPTPGATPSPTPVAIATPPPATATPSPTTTPTPQPPVTGSYQRGVNLAGAEFGERALPGTHGVDYTYPTAAELDYYRGKGLTLIRLPFRWERVQRSLYAPLDSAELGYIDQVVAAARARGMGVILDPHNYARYHSNLIGSSAVPNAAFSDAQGAYPTIGVERVRSFVEWLQVRGARGFIGEYGVPDNDARWLTVLDNFLAYLDAAGVSGTYWAGGPWWGNYPLSVEPRDGQDRPQIAILVRHLSR